MRNNLIKHLATLLCILLMTPIGAVIVQAEPEVYTFPRNDMAPEGLDWMDATPDMLGTDELLLRKQAALIGPELATGASPLGAPAVIGDEFTITVSDFYWDIDYDEDFVVLMEGVHGILLIEKAAYDNYDPVTDEYVFPNPYGTGGRFEDRISTLMLEYMLDEFDNTIYPTVTEVYGEPLPRGDEGQKVWILIFNIRDESYYNDDVTVYTGGYFSASESAENNKNIMHIDTFDWYNRIGPDAPRPFCYEGIFAHEFEHLVHFDADPDEPSWVDEGMADLAGFFCGYGHPEDHLAYYMVYHPMVSLTFWGGGLEDYGASYLFTLYLYEHFGGAEFISAVVAEQANGIEGIELTLDAFRYKESFDDIFDRWVVANYIDDTRKARGRYGYESVDIGSFDTWGYSIEYALENMWWGPPDTVPFGISSDWFFGIEPQPYTAHYFRFTNEADALLSLDGDDFSGTTAYSGSYEWYSDADAWAWRSFYQTFSVPAGGATLNFMTFYEIEEDWDYGYVEVYDQNTDEWYTLDAAGTVNYVAHVQDNPNTPSEREPTAYEAAGRWHAFTGYSGGWIPVSMDLTPFAGHIIDVYFTSWQDGAFTLQMMYVDDVSIPEIGFFDDVESGEDGWSTTGWYVTDGIRANGWGTVLMDTKWVPSVRYPEPAGNNAMSLHSVKEMMTDSDTQTGEMLISETPMDSGRMKVLVIANHAGHILTSHYDLIVQNQP